MEYQLWKNLRIVILCLTKITICNILSYIAKQTYKHKLLNKEEYQKMAEKDIKRKLEDQGVRVVDVARQLAKDFGIKENSATTMMREMIAGKSWFQKYAVWFEQNYQIKIPRPNHLRPIRERMRAA